MATEKRLIDANEAIERAKNSDKIVGSSIWETGEVVEFLEDSPTVEAVEVVRCKNCMNYEERCPGFGYCYHWDYEQGMSPNQVDADDFCSYGERRTDEKAD